MLNLIKKSLFCIALLGMISQVSAAELYIFQDTQLKSKDGKTAKIYIGVPVKVKKSLGEESEVSIQGYLDGDKLYSSASKELVIAELEKGFKTSKKGKETVVTGLVETGILSEDSTEIWAEHEEFYYDMCSVCHAAQQVTHHTMLEWEALFIPMKGFAKLDEEEASYLLRYLKSNASNGLVKTKH